MEKKEVEAKLIEQHAHQLEREKEICNEEFVVSLKARTYNYRKTICDLLKQIRRKDEEYKKLQEEKECAHVEQYSWCYLVRELLKQYQKLINYVLKEKSGKAEYFISLHKLLNSRIESLTDVSKLILYLHLFEIQVVLGSGIIYDLPTLFSVLYYQLQITDMQ